MRCRSGKKTVQLRRTLLALTMTAVLVNLPNSAQPQEGKIDSSGRGRLKDMLRVVQGDLKKNYYDSQFHGLDLDVRFRAAQSGIDSATTVNHALSEIAAALTDLNDSHTFFIPPPRPFKHDYGWTMQAVGDSGCFITAVRPGSDADRKGVKPGDQVETVNGFTTSRGELWKLNYVFRILRPQVGLHLRLKSPQGVDREVDAMAQVRPGTLVASFSDMWDFERQEENRERVQRPRFFEYGKDAVILKLPDFSFDPEHADRMLDRIRLHSALVLDLRNNPGGYAESLSRFLGGFFDHEIKIADRIGRRAMKPEVSKSRGDKTFQGKLVVLIDGGSASAAELFARVVQLEKRGIVLGDRSSGSVMESRLYEHTSGTQIATLFGEFITEADLVMSDGGHLEHVGVQPDELALPTPEDLALGRDPALANALGRVGVKSASEEAGKLFPVEWQK